MNTSTRPEPLIYTARGCSFERTITYKGSRLRKLCATYLDKLENEQNQGEEAINIDDLEVARGKGKRKRSSTFKLADT